MGGPLDRLHDVVTGVGGGFQAIPGLVWDFGRAPFVDDEVDGILGTVNATFVSRGGQFFGNLFGPEEGLGAAVGAVPAGIREPIGSGIIGPVFGGIETAGREVIREPLSTAFTAGSLAASETFLAEEGRGTGTMDQLLALGDPDTWQTAHLMAQDRSVGQSVALMFGTKDILDEEEVERFAGTDMYTFASGTTDLLTRIFLEPDLLTFKAGSAVRGARLSPGRGRRLGQITTQAAPQLGQSRGLLTRRVLGAEQTGTLGRRATAINNTIDRSYEHLPSFLRKGREFGPGDISRLERLERTRWEMGAHPAQSRTAELQRQAQEATDPARRRVLENVVEQRRVRETRVGTGQAQPRQFQQQLAQQLKRDIDAYFSAPSRKGQASTLLAGPGWRRVDAFIDSLPADVDERAGLIHDRLFPGHHRGDVISRYLAEARGPAEREAVMRVSMGDMRALKSLRESDYALGMRLQDLALQRSMIRAEAVVPPIPSDPVTGQQSLLDPNAIESSPVLDDHQNYVERLTRIGDEIDAVASEAERNHRLSQTLMSLPAGPTWSRGQQARHTLKSSAFYQRSVFGKGLRLFTDMRPHHIVATEDPGAPAQLGRMLREAGYDDQAIHRARGQFDGVAPAARGAKFQEWIERAERTVLKRHGLDEDEIGEVLAAARLGRNQANAFLRGTAYDAEGRARVRIPDGDEFLEAELPLSVTQLQNTAVVPNFHLLNKHAARYARLKYGDDWRGAISRGASPAWTAKEFGVDALRGVMEVWRPAVLLRPAWTMRVVGDEQARMIAKFGALSVALGAREAIHNYGASLRTNPALKRIFRADEYGRLSRRTSVASAAGGAVAGGVAGGPLGAIAGGGLGNRIVRNLAKAEERGYNNIRFGGHSISGPFGDAGSAGEFYRVHNSARGSVDEIFGRHENRFYHNLKRDPKRWRTYVWGESNQTDAVYRAEWARNLRRQIAQDDMGRQFLSGKSIDQVYDWLENTLEGRQYAALVPWRSDRRAWVEAYSDQIERYTGGIDDVKRSVLANVDKSDDTVGQFLDLVPEGQRAPIHGAETDQLQARSAINQAINGFVDNAFDVLGTLATDNLSRNPTFKRFYEAEARRLFSTIAPGQVPQQLIRSLEDQARSFALRETRQLLYDLAETSRFADMARLLIPFYNAWQEVLTRWSGLAVENPLTLSRGHQLWNVPERLGWIYTDDRGEEFMRFRIPEFAQGIVNQGAFKSALDSQGYVFLDKKGLNLVAQGTPGFGPIVQVPVSEAVKANPSIEESVRFILPFGPTEGVVDSFLPPTVRRAMATNAGNEGGARANARARILTTKLAQMQNGEIEPIDLSDPVAREAFLDDVEKETTAFMSLRLFSGFVAPVAPLYESPYKPYIDIYRALRTGDIERAREVGEEFGVEAVANLPTAIDEGDRDITADDIFLEAFGEEYFSVTQSFTESLNGIPPTVEGLETQEQFADLITAYPEWGGVIAGYDAGGEAAKFSRAVYDRQLSRGERRRLEGDEILEGPNIRLGWSHYSKFMDMIEAVRVARGLPNLQVKAAEDLSRAKRLIILGLAERYPSWYREFSITDRGTWNNRIEGARQMVENPSLINRPDIQGLSDYLQLRDFITSVLSTRESVTLNSTDNQDLMQLWQGSVAQLVERNPEFADLYYRKLENDPVEA